MLNAAIIGLGWWGRQIVTCMADSDRLRITHAVDVAPDQGAEFAQAHGIMLGDSYEKALADAAVDAVILTTPNALHEAQVLAAARAGKQVFCEKPLALDAAAARRMVDACRERGLILGLGHERRYEPALDKVRRLLKGGELGQLLHLESNWSHNRFSAAVRGGWRWDEKQSPAGALTTTGIHIIDLFQYIAGPVAEVHALNRHRSDSYPGKDVLLVRFDFTNGATGIMCNLASTPFYCRINVFGDKGWAEATEVSNMDEPDPATLVTRGMDLKLHSREFPSTNTVRANLDNWADAVEGRAEYRFTDEQKVHGIAIFEAILKSIASGQPEPV